MVPTVIYTAAHGGFDLDRVPLGGAATVCRLLTEEWGKTRPFEVRVLTPDLLGDRAPKDKDLVQYSELRYARFCSEFETAITDEILRCDPNQTVVLSNDISEGPDFQRLSNHGFRIYSLYHVDVVDYFSSIYLRGLIRPERLTALYERLHSVSLDRWIPKVLKLIYKKQRDSVIYSRGLIVPSEGMKRVLVRCYPRLSQERIHVLPWGMREETLDPAAVDQRAAELRQQYGIPAGARVLMTLSRISPEKGQDRLLKALKVWEESSDFPTEGVWTLLCGEPAYMKGIQFQRVLKRLAGKLRKARVLFPGYLSGLEKQAHFRLADLYVFPSRHESYGLTLLEACRAGLPTVACPHYGAEDMVRGNFGELLPPADEDQIPERLHAAISRLVTDRERLRQMGANARAYAETCKISETARRLAGLIAN